MDLSILPLLNAFSFSWDTFLTCSEIFFESTFLKNFSASGSSA